MGARIREILQSIFGNAIWTAIQTYLGVAMIVTFLSTLWGWFTNLPSPILFQHAVTIFAIMLFITQIWKDKDKKSISVLSEQQQQKIEKLQQEIEALKRQRVSTPTVEETIEFVTDLKNHNQIRIKIIATKEGQRLAKMLVQAFCLAGYTVLTNNDGTDYFFSAATKHDKVIIRYREANMSQSDSLALLSSTTHQISCQALASRIRIFIRVDEYQPFPDSSSIDYFQIEIGGGL